MNTREFWRFVMKFVFGGLIIFFLIGISFELLKDWRWSRNQASISSESIQKPKQDLEPKIDLNTNLLGSWNRGEGESNIANKGIYTFEKDSTFYNNLNETGKYIFIESNSSEQKQYILYLHYDKDKTEKINLDSLSEYEIRGNNDVFYKLLDKKAKPKNKGFGGDEPERVIRKNTRFGDDEPIIKDSEKKRKSLEIDIEN